MIVVDEPELTAIGAALIAAQGATNIALPFGEGLDLRKIEPVAAWIERYAGLYQDYGWTQPQHNSVASAGVAPPA